MNFHLRNKRSFKTELVVFPNKTQVGKLETKATFLYFQVHQVSAHYCLHTIA